MINVILASEEGLGINLCLACLQVSLRLTGTNTASLPPPLPLRQPQGKVVSRLTHAACLQTPDRLMLMCWGCNWCFRLLHLPVELLGTLFQGSQYSKLLCQPMAALDSDSQQLCCLVLECLAHLFSWIPLSTNITPTLLASIFHFARFGCDLRTKEKTGSFVSSNSSSTNGQLNAGTVPPVLNGGGQNAPQGGGSKVDRARLGVLAMTCVNELVSKNCVPMDFEEYLLRMFQQTFFLLQRMTRENNAHTVKSRLQELDERCGACSSLLWQNNLTFNCLLKC